MAHHPPLEVTEDLRQRFERSVCKTAGDCWEWTGRRGPKGYGRFKHQRRDYAAHRVSYELATGQHPGRLLICHHCDNPPCVNPAHLFAGTTADNTADRLRKGRFLQRKGANNPRAKLTPEQVRAIRVSEIGNKPLARHYGVAPVTIRDARLGRTWSSIA